MTEYISFVNAINTITKSKLLRDNKFELIEAFQNIPAADVRPVVLCCDCKHFQANVSPSGYLPQGVPEWECRYWCRPTDPTDFCSYGEKREET